MPTYEYLCEKCGHRFENFQSITSAPIKKCPNCGKNAVKRLISGGATLIFKGSGFYITDYRDSAYTEKAKADSDASKPAESTAAKEPAAGESKPAATEAKPKTDAKETKPAAKAEPKPAAKSESKSESKSGKSKSKS